MKMIASRVLAARPGDVWKDLAREGVVVITRDGRPCSIMLPTSDATLVEDVQEHVFAKARRAVSAMRREAAAAGTQDLSMAEIDAEIRRARKARRRRAPHV